MHVLTDLWLPIVLSSVLVFILSSIIHMVVKFHDSDYRRLPGEEKILAAIRSEKAGAGDFVFPWAGSMQERATPEMKEKYEKGPVGFITILPPGPMNMGRGLILWFLYSLLIGLFTGYAARLGLAPGAEPMIVFRLTSTVAVLGYGFSYIPDWIWKGLSGRTMAKFLVDGVLYGLVTAAVFTWLWPGGM